MQQQCTITNNRLSGLSEELQRLPCALGHDANLALVRRYSGLANGYNIHGGLFWGETERRCTSVYSASPRLYRVWPVTLGTCTWCKIAELTKDNYRKTARKLRLVCSLLNGSNFFWANCQAGRDVKVQEQVRRGSNCIVTLLA